MKAFWLERYFPTMTAEPQHSLARIEQAFKGAQFSWRHAQYANLDGQNFDARDELPKIKAEALVISGAHDMLPLEHGEEIAAGIPFACFGAFEHSGHFAPLEEPQRFEKLVWDFLGAGSPEHPRRGPASGSREGPGGNETGAETTAG